MGNIQAKKHKMQAGEREYVFITYILESDKASQMV